MKESSEQNKNWSELRSKILGLGENSMRKSFYPELQNRINELEILKNLIHQLDDMVLMGYLPEGKIFYRNSLSETNLFNTEDSLTNDTFDQLVGDQFFSSLLEDYSRFKYSNNQKSDKPLIFEIELHNSFYEVVVNLNQISGNYYFTAVFRDISKRKTMELKLKQEQENLEEKVKKRTLELEESNSDLARFNELFVGREFRIKELKDKVAELESKLSR